ncbi:MAG: Mg(2+) transport ATPase protein [Labilithrix sp.]|nr:Mg(2+) transport ATPase protein [Labilithrix sp.]
MLAHSELLVRVATGAALGGVIGYERGRHGRPVGLRTHLIVALASATFMIVSSQFAYYQHFEHGDGIEVDASRIAASVVSAVGFLAGGAILRSGLSVQGLTTAAGLWLVTAIGLCAGAGMYLESSVVTTLGIVALTIFRRFEDKNDLVTKRRISIVLANEVDASTHVMKAITDLGAVVADVEYERRLDDKPRTALTLDVSLPAAVTTAMLIATLETLPSVKRIQISQPS